MKGRRLGLYFETDLATYRHHYLEVAVISQNVLDRVEEDPSVALVIAKILTFRTPRSETSQIQTEIGRKEEIKILLSCGAKPRTGLVSFRKKFESQLTRLLIF